MPLQPPPNKRKRGQEAEAEAEAGDQETVLLIAGQGPAATSPAIVGVARVQTKKLAAVTRVSLVHGHGTPMCMYCLIAQAS